jgi:hypothetical protein
LFIVFCDKINGTQLGIGDNLSAKKYTALVSVLYVTTKIDNKCMNKENDRLTEFEH